MGYFKSFFGPSRDEIWSALRAQIGGEIIPGTFWRGERLQARVSEWTLHQLSEMGLAGSGTGGVTV